MDKDLAGLYNHFRLTEEEDEIVDMSNVSDQVGAFLLAGRVLSSKPLNPNSLSAAFRELWRTEKNFKLFEIGNEEMFVVEFESERDRDRVLEDGPWSFDSQLAILGELSGDEQPSKLKMDHCNFWVWFCDLPFNCRNKDAISLIGSKIGRVVQIEISNNWGNFVKVRISINISKPLMRGIRIMNSKREIIWVYFRYEKLSNYCYWCGVIGHVHENCDKIRAEMVELDEEGNSNWPYGSSLCASNGGEEGDDRSSGDVKEINQLDAEEISGPNVEEERLKKLQMLDEENQALKSSFINVHLSSDERDIGRLIRQISGSKKNVSESDDSDYELSLDGQSYLMDKVGMVEGALFELSEEHQVGVKEEIRNKISELEMELMRESEKYDSVVRRVEKYREARKESERKFDTQYQRKIAEALDNHLTAIQRDHELKSQIEERRIRSDAAHEEAKRREKALQEERLYQERVRAEAEAKRKAEEAKMVALEAERKAAKEAAEKEAAEKEAAEEEAAKRVTAVVLQGDVAGSQKNVSSGNQNIQNMGSRSNGQNKTDSSVGTVVKAAESALNLEQERLKKLKMLDEENQALKSRSNMGFSNYESHIARLIRQVRGSRDSVRAKSTELVKIFMNPSCPQSISIAAFVKKVVSACESPDSSAAFACGKVIVQVTSQVPHAMDILLAEFHKACIYTVPKHIAYSKALRK